MRSMRTHSDHACAAWLRLRVHIHLWCPSLLGLSQPNDGPILLSPQLDSSKVPMEGTNDWTSQRRWTRPQLATGVVSEVPFPRQGRNLERKLPEGTQDPKSIWFFVDFCYCHLQLQNLETDLFRFLNRPFPPDTRVVLTPRKRWPLVCRKDGS